MKISLNWINDYVDITKLDKELLIKRLGLSTCEIDEVIYKGIDLSGIITARIIEVLDVEGSKKLHKLKLDLGNGKIGECLCGAPNVRVGLITAFAQIGANVRGLKIEPVKMAGTESRGMCCGPDELGMNDEHTIIIELDEKTEIGVDIKNVLPIEDIILDIDNKSLTNRPDLFSHIGFAREIAAIFNLKLKEPKFFEIKNDETLPKIKVKIEDKEACRRYAMVKLSNITTKTSDFTTQIRLFYCGMRSLNLLADISNYVMMDIGQPTHCFDGDKIKSIEVNFAKDGEIIKTLDGRDRVLNTSDLLIRTSGKPSAIAGVMGGEDSKIIDTTTSVCLESATFAAKTIRLTSRRLGLISEASMRYEKSLDPELASLAIGRFYYLIKKLDKNVKIASQLTDEYVNKYKLPIINVTRKFIEDVSSVKTKKGDIEKVLMCLGFGVVSNGENLKVTVPSFRATKDVSIKEDLVEEFARIYGYDNIAPVAPKFETQAKPQTVDLEYEVKHMLASFGMNEVHTYIWSDINLNNKLNIKTLSHAKTINSIVKENNEIRSELMPSLVKTVMQNKEKMENISVFEIGRVVSSLNKDGNVNEEKRLGIVIANNNDEKQEFIKLKDLVYNLFACQFNINVDICLDLGVSQNLHPKNAYKISYRGENLGYFGVIHPNIKKEIQNKKTILSLEIFFDKLYAVNPILNLFKEVNKYQTTTLDFTFNVDKELEYGKLEKIAEGFKTSLNKKIKLVDIFTKSEIKAITISMIISRDDKTLVGDEITEFHEGFIKYMKENNINI